MFSIKFQNVRIKLHHTKSLRISEIKFIIFQNLRVSRAYVRIPYPKRRKLVNRAYEGFFILYETNSKTYRFYDLVIQVIIESNVANFFEDRFFFKSRNSGELSSSHLPLIRAQTSNEEIDPKPRRSKRNSTIKDFGDEFKTYNEE